MRDRKIVEALHAPRFIIALFCLALAGCATAKRESPAQPRTQNAIDELNVVAMPVALNLDAAPGVDGFAIQVYAVDRTRPKTQPIRDGSLDILMYDGLVKEIISDTSQYRHVWSFTANQLKPHAATSAIGASYRFTLNWGADNPRDDKITLIVRYRPDQGQAVYSAPSAIAVPGKAPVPKGPAQSP